MKYNFFITITLVLLLSFSTLSQTSALDNTFGTNGVVTTNLPNKSLAGYAIKIQNDGKILVAGSAWGNNIGEFLVIRYNIDGTLDNTFGVNGVTTISLNCTVNDVWSIDIQADGKIVLAGTSNIGASNDFAIVRLNNNGSIDSTFDSDGIAIYDIGTNSQDGCSSLAIQSDGKIIAAGSTSFGFFSNIALIRVNTDGTLDNSFNNNGKVITSVGGFSLCGANSIKIQQDGKIIISGMAQTTATDSDFCLVRYNSNGSLDNTFDSDGVVLTSFGTDEESAFSIAVQTDGKIIAAGHYKQSFSDDDFAIARYNSDGTLDNTFGISGKITTDLGSADDIAFSISIQSDGKYVAAGTFSFHPNCCFAVVRYNTNGTLDNSFDNDGIFISHLTNLSELCAATIQSDNKILVTGCAINSGTCVATTIRLNSVFVNNIFKETIEDDGVMFYPNPVSDILNLSSIDTHFDQISVLNNLGQELMRTNYQTKIDFSNYPEGIYSLIVRSPKKRITKKIIVIR